LYLTQLLHHNGDETLSFLVEFLEWEWVFRWLHRINTFFHAARPIIAVAVASMTKPYSYWTTSSVPLQSVRGFMFRKQIICSPVLSLTRMIAAMLCWCWMIAS